MTKEEIIKETKKLQNQQCSTYVKKKLKDLEVAKLVSALKGDWKAVDVYDNRIHNYKYLLELFKKDEDNK